MFLLYLFISFFVTAAHAGMPATVAQKKVMHYDIVQNIFSTVLYQPASPSIITEHEWKEFQLDRLITILDRTKTSFGRWGLTQLLQPIADSHELALRKEIITFLIEHETELSLLQQQLSKIHEVEKALLAYWDRGDAVDAGAQQFYYSLPGVRDKLNGSSLALNGSVATQMFDAFRNLIVAMCLSGVQEEFGEWLLNKEKHNVDLWGGMMKGLTKPFQQHSWGTTEYGEKPEGGYGYKDYVRAITYGSWGDRYKVLSEGFTLDAAKTGVPMFFNRPEAKAAVGLFGKLSAVVGASAQTLLYDYYWGSSLLSVGSHILSMNQTLNQLYDRIVDVATCFNGIKSIKNIIKKYPAIADNHYTAIEYDTQVNDCLKSLAASRFAKKGSYLYSRGHVLSMHREIKKIKKSFVPMLQSIAFLDAYCSIAQLYKESQQQAVKFSFPEFVPSPTPFLSYEDAWLPLLTYKQAIANDLCLGVVGQQGCPGKIIITGPNGGGKSTILKTYGVAVILAQSWFIIPAMHGTQTLFAEIKTGLAPREDLEQGLSTFMAEKKRMLELFESMKKSDAQNNNTIVLIDEPYKGTVDDESAKRIYQFGKEVAGFSHTLVAIATHVKKPVALAVDTQGIFGNYQVKIKEVSKGVFERLFKLEKGPATWWFEDADKRSRFVDWISGSSPLTEKEKQQAKQDEELLKQVGRRARVSD